MPDEPLDASTVELLRREAFDETGRMAFMAEDYARMLFDAAEERNLMAVAVRLQQLRFCALAMIGTFNHVLRKTPTDGQGVAAAEPARSDCEDQRPGDGVA